MTLRFKGKIITGISLTPFTRDVEGKVNLHTDYNTGYNPELSIFDEAFF